MSTIRIPCRLAPHRAAALCLQSKLFGSSTSSSSAPPAILNTTTHTTASTTTLTRYPQQRRPRTKQSRNHSSLSRASQTSRFQRFPAPRCASYHSYDHPVPPAAFSSVERTILAAAYAHVPQHGFSQAALALGARDAGYLDISTNLLPDGVFSLIQWHLVSQRESLAGRAQVLFAVGDEGQGAGERLGMGRKVEMLTWERLMGNQLVIRRWQEALAIMAQPSYVPASLQELAKLADEIWFLVGDTSVDPSWYTKRASLSTIYASTELFMTTDTSEGYIETRKFLRRRLAEVHNVGGTLKSLGQWVGFTANAGLNVLRSKGMPI